MTPIRNAITRLIPQSGFLRGVSVLTAGTVVAQLLVVLAAPVLTRLYSPEDFGLLAVFSSLLFPLSVISSLRYQLAIPLPEAKEDAAALTILSAVIVICLSIILAILAPIFSSRIGVWMDMPDIESYLWLLPVGFLMLGIYEVLHYWAIRKGAFSTLAKTKVVQSAGMVSVQLLGAAAGPGSLLVGQIVGHGAGVSGLARLPFRKDFTVFRSVNLSMMVNVAKRYKNFPLISTWGAVFNTTGSRLPPLLFAAFFSQSVAGFYALAERILAGPLQLVGQSVANVFLSRAPEMHKQGLLGEMVMRVHSVLAALAAPPAIMLALSGADLFAFVFGERWGTSGLFAQWMSPWLYFMAVSSPLTMVFTVREKLLHNTAFQMGMLLVRVSALTIGAMFGDVVFALAIFATCSSVCYLVLLAIIMRISGNSWVAIFIPTVREAAFGIAINMPLIFVVFVIQDVQYAFLVGFIVSTLFLLIRYRYIMATYRTRGPGGV